LLLATKSNHGCILVPDMIPIGLVHLFAIS